MKLTRFIKGSDEGAELNYAVIAEVITDIRKEGKIKDIWAEEIKNRNRLKGLKA